MFDSVYLMNLSYSLYFLFRDSSGVVKCCHVQFLALWADASAFTTPTFTILYSPFRWSRLVFMLVHMRTRPSSFAVGKYCGWMTPLSPRTLKWFGTSGHWKWMNRCVCVCHSINRDNDYFILLPICTPTGNCMRCGESKLLLDTSPSFTYLHLIDRSFNLNPLAMPPRPPSKAGERERESCVDSDLWWYVYKRYLHRLFLGQFWSKYFWLLFEL